MEDLVADTINITVGDHPLAAINLKTGEPDGPAVVQCVDADGPVTAKLVKAAR